MEKTHDRILSIRLPGTLVGQIEAYAADASHRAGVPVSFSAALRAILAKGLGLPLPMNGDAAHADPEAKSTEAA